jgi:hypothetical protein
MKSEAAELRVQARSAGQTLAHSAALEQVARKHGFASWRACVAVLNRRDEAAAAGSAVTPAPAMKRYTSDWGFELDVPASWNEFPPVHVNSPWEVARFFSREAGKTHGLIVFRSPRDPTESLEARIETQKTSLSARDFGNFVHGESVVGSDLVPILDFDRLTGSPWSCRYYLFGSETLNYTLGFGTTDRDSTLDLYQRMAESFFITA